MLKKHIGKKALFLLLINAILGTGIFFLPAVGYAVAGSASLVAWIAMSLVAVLISLYFAELVSLYPRSGGIYEYARHAFGEFTAFVAGWTAWIVTNMTIAMLIVGSLRYLFPAAGMLFNIAASLAIIAAFNYVSYRGISLSSAVMAGFGVITLAVLLAIILPGAPLAAAQNFSFPPVALPVMLLAIYLIAETFFGWESATYLSEEIRDARKALPKLLVGTTAVIAVIAIAVVAVAIGVAGDELGASGAPLALVAEKIYGSHGSSPLFALLIFIPLIGTAASWIIASPRLLYAMSRDRVISPRLQKLSRHATPHYAIAFQALVTAAATLVAFADYLTILQMLVPLVIVIYSFVMLSVVKLRFAKPDARRFNAPFAREVPLLIVMFLFYLLYIWSSQPGAYQLLALDAFLVVFGVPLYFLIKLSDKRFVEKFFDRASPLVDKTLPLWYTKKDISSVMRRLRLRRSDVVLDFGAGSGYTTTAIAKRVRDGVVVAVDISEKQLLRASRRAKRSREHNIIFLKESDPAFVKRSFDAVAGVGVLEYLDAPEATIRKLMSLLKPGGCFCFLSFGRSFIFPAPPHLASEAAVRALFPKGVSVNAQRKRRKLTEYWLIWGKKN